MPDSLPETAPLPSPAEVSAMDCQPLLPGLADISPEQEAGMVAARDTLGDYSGVRIYERMPRMYALVSGMLAEGLSDAMICRVSGLSRNTIASIRRREVDSLSHRAYSAAQARNLRLAATLATDEIRERLSDPEARAEMSLRDVAYAAQIMQSLAQLLAGEPTERVAELRSTGADSSLRALLSGRVIDVEAEARTMDSGGKCGASREGSSDVSGEGAEGSASDGAGGDPGASVGTLSDSQSTATGA